MLSVGDIAPEIDSPTTDGMRFVLSQGQGVCTVVFFYPRAFTTGCTAQAENFRDNRAELVLAGARIVGISMDRSDTQCRFAREMGLSFPLIADTNGAIATAYHVKVPLLGLSRRVTFVVGGDTGRIEAVFEHATIVPFRPKTRLAFVDQVLAFLHQRRHRRAGGR
jgi:peroxiredoxin Q/BCP